MAREGCPASCPLMGKGQGCRWRGCGGLRADAGPELEWEGQGATQKARLLSGSQEGGLGSGAARSGVCRERGLEAYAIQVTRNKTQ